LPKIRALVITVQIKLLEGEKTGPKSFNSLESADLSHVPRADLSHLLRVRPALLKNKEDHNQMHSLQTTKTRLLVVAVLQNVEQELEKKEHPDIECENDFLFFF
jgi:hypothetical protein